MLTAGEQRNLQTCKVCAFPLGRTPSAPSTQVMETLDNGVMAKKVVRFKDADALARQRAASDPRLKPLD